MPEEYKPLAQTLPFWVWNHGDPPPWIFHVLDRVGEAEVAKISINARIEMLNVQANALKQIVKVLGDRALK